MTSEDQIFSPAVLLLKTFSELSKNAFGLYDTLIWISSGEGVFAFEESEIVNIYKVKSGK